MTAADLIADENRKNARKNEIMENGPVNDEPDFSDPEDFVDNIKDEDLLPDLLAEKPSENDGKDCVVIVYGIPTVKDDVFSKLQGVLKRQFDKVGKVVDIYYPKQEKDGTVLNKCFVFVAYEEKKKAEEAASFFDGHRLDKQHTFSAYVLSDIHKYKNVPERFDKPTPRPYKDHGNLKSWLLSPDCHDQYVVQYQDGDSVAVYLNTPLEPTLLQEKTRWTETIIRWSPRGTYLATFHNQGIALWGGDKFEQIQKFPHQGVSHIDFSPCEKYLVTYSIPKSRYGDTNDAIRIWDIRTGEMKRGFPSKEGTVKHWPYLRWSFDDNYFCVKKQYSIHVYETESFALHLKKPIEIDGLNDFAWSPTSTLLAYWSEERDQIPARFGLINVPDRSEVRTKNIFNVADAAIYWQKQGRYVCMKVDRYGKKTVKKDEGVRYSTMSYNLEIFHVNFKEVPNNTLEIKETIRAFAWEPVGTKFCVIHGEIKHAASFYSVRQGNLMLLKSIDSKNQLNTICWAPSGTYCVLTALSVPLSGALMFVDTTSDNINLINSQEHTGLTSIDWDPTGRYVTTSVSSLGGKGDYGYMLWNFQGQLKQRRPLKGFRALCWRPRPPSLLGEAKIKEVKKNMKDYVKKFEEKDRQVLTKASKEILEKRRDQKSTFESWRKEKLQKYETERGLRIDLRGGGMFDEEEEEESEEMAEETIELLVKEAEEIVVRE